MKTKLLGVVAACALSISVGQARADTFEIFNASGTYGFDINIPPQSFTGTITVNVTTGMISAAALNLVGSWMQIIDQGPSQNNPQLYHVTIQATRFNAGTFDNGTSSCGGYSPGGCHDSLHLGLSASPALLVANNGGFIVPDGNSSLYDCGCDIISVTGVLTPAPVPLPSALPLFATGLGALGLLGWRRKKKAAVVT